jgi:hypothetical protein
MSAETPRPCGGELISRRRFGGACAGRMGGAAADVGALFPARCARSAAACLKMDRRSVLAAAGGLDAAVVAADAPSLCVVLTRLLPGSADASAVGSTSLSSRRGCLREGEAASELIWRRQPDEARSTAAVGSRLFTSWSAVDVQTRCLVRASDVRSFDAEPDRAAQTKAKQPAAEKSTGSWRPGAPGGRTQAWSARPPSLSSPSACLAPSTDSRLACRCAAAAQRGDSLSARCSRCARHRPSAWTPDGAAGSAAPHHPHARTTRNRRSYRHTLRASVRTTVLRLRLHFAQPLTVPRALLEFRSCTPQQHSTLALRSS